MVYSRAYPVSQELPSSKKDESKKRMDNACFDKSPSEDEEWIILKKSENGTVFASEEDRSSRDSDKLSQVNHKSPLEDEKWTILKKFAKWTGVSSEEDPSEADEEWIVLKSSAKWTAFSSEEDGSLGMNIQNPHCAKSGQTSLIPQIGRNGTIYCLLKCPRSVYGSIALVNRNFHSLIRSGELYRIRRQLGITEYWVYFSCEMLEWNAFDPVSLKVMQLPKMSDDESAESNCFKYSDKQSLAVGTELLVFGTGINSQRIYKYSLLTNSWSEATPMNEGRYLFGSASTGEIGIVAGGCDRNGNVLSSAEYYNAETGSWVTLPSLNKPRKMCSGVFLNGNFYVIGGIGVDNTNMHTSAEAYDMKTRTWLEIPNMLPASKEEASWKAPPLLAVVKNNLYAAFSDEHELRKYDKVGSVWVTMGRLPERAGSVHGWGIAFRACGDMLIVIGGPRSMGGGFVEVNGWVPDGGPPQWRLLGRKQSSNFVYNCAVMGC